MYTTTKATNVSKYDPDFTYASNNLKDIDSARVFMILGVILIHCNILACIPQNDVPYLTNVIVRFFSEYWPQFCVPWFFVISAYLSGLKCERFTKTTYLNLLKKRCKSIFIPYVLWNTIAFLFWQCVNMTFLSKYTSGGYDFVSINQFILDVYVSPILVPLWFLRSLMIFVILLPFLKIILNKSTLLLIIVSIFLEQFSPFSGIIYYSLGLILSKHPDIIEHCFKYSHALVIIYSLIVLCSALSPDYIGLYTFNVPIIRDVLVIIGLFAFWWIALKIKINHNLCNVPSLVFFMYVFHGIISPYVIKGMAMVFPWHGNYWIIDYLAVYFLVVAFSYLIYSVSSKFMPRILNILTGQRQYSMRTLTNCLPTIPN